MSIESARRRVKMTGSRGRRNTGRGRVTGRMTTNVIGKIVSGLGVTRRKLPASNRTPDNSNPINLNPNKKIANRRSCL